MSSGDHKFSKTRAVKQRRSLKQKYKKAIEAGDENRALEIARLYLDSDNVKKLAAMDVRDKMRPHMRPSVPEMLRIGEKADVWSECDEPVYVSFIPKDGANQLHRPILNFGPLNKTKHGLVADVVGMHFVPHPNQYLMNGGRHKAIEAVKAAWAEGYQFGVHVDLETFFQKIGGGELHKILKLPKEVIKHVVLAMRYNLLTSRSLSRILCEPGQNLPIEHSLPVVGIEVEAFRRGIPQGSALSPLCAEVILHEVVSALPILGVVVNYADDFLILCKAPNDRAALLSALKGVLVNHPATDTGEPPSGGPS